MHPVDLPIIDLNRYAPDRSFYAVFRDGTRPVADHRQDFYELMHILSGEGIHTLNGREWHLRAGQTWCIGADDRHAIHPANSQLSWINVAIPSEPWKAFLTLTSATVPSPVWEGCMQDPFHAALLAYYRGESPWALLDFLSHVLKAAPVSPVVPAWLAGVLAELDKPSGLRSGVVCLRNQASVSASHFSRTIQKHFGLSPSMLLHRKRLERSAYLLINSSQPVAEIAGDCGFNSLAYFHREFRHHYGRTPLRYRTEARAATDV
jgi:AraC family cel operon transcriptional repressor